MQPTSKHLSCLTFYSPSMLDSLQIFSSYMTLQVTVKLLIGLPSSTFRCLAMWVALRLIIGPSFQVHLYCTLRYLVNDISRTIWLLLYELSATCIDQDTPRAYLEIPNGLSANVKVSGENLRREESEQEVRAGVNVLH